MWGGLSTIDTRSDVSSCWVRVRCSVELVLPCLGEEGDQLADAEVANLTLDRGMTIWMIIVILMFSPSRLLSIRQLISHFTFGSSDIKLYQRPYGTTGMLL